MAKRGRYNSGVDRKELGRLLKVLDEKVDDSLLGMLLKEGSGFLGRVGSSEAPPEGDSEWQNKIIDSVIPECSSVLDLGCGEGRLLERMATCKQARVQGIELDPDNVEVCVARGVPVIQADLDLGLSVFPDKSFDYVILEETLQTLRRPDRIIAEMRRVGCHGIVTFPNFGYWRVRMDLAVRGRMPVSGWLPYRWYETPNIHLFTILDFVDYANDTGMEILSIHVLRDGASHLYQPGDNLYAEEAIVVFE